MKFCYKRKFPVLDKKSPLLPNAFELVKVYCLKNIHPVRERDGNGNINRDTRLKHWQLFEFVIEIVIDIEIFTFSQQDGATNSTALPYSPQPNSSLENKSLLGKQ